MIICEVFVSIMLFVGSLPLTLNEKSLNDIFKIYGTVLKAIIATDSHTGRSSGFGYVEMEAQSDARNAINALNGLELNGKSLLVKQAHQNN
jgi:RNA recognition motif-containing protein